MNGGFSAANGRTAQLYVTTWLSSGNRGLPSGRYTGSIASPIDSATIKSLAAGCGFELAGIAPALPLAEAAFYRDWVDADFAGRMSYLTDHRVGVREDPRRLLPSARSMICVGKLYNGPQPYSTEFTNPELGWISRYAWGEDYHTVLRDGLGRLAERLRERSEEAFECKICVDTAPLLERAYARQAGLGWIGKNSCLIREGAGSWFFLGELLVSLELEPDRPPPDRCGTCTRCIEACPTAAIVPAPGTRGPAFTVDSRLCISYLTIELRGPMPAEIRERTGAHVFGCDICQDVCPWNRQAPVSPEPRFAAKHFAPPLEKLADLTAEQFRELFRDIPVSRARYSGFLRNVAIAMGNAKHRRFRKPLERLAASDDETVAEHARWAIAQLDAEPGDPAGT